MRYDPLKKVGCAVGDVAGRAVSPLSIPAHCEEIPTRVQQILEDMVGKCPTELPFDEDGCEGNSDQDI